MAKGSQQSPVSLDKWGHGIGALGLTLFFRATLGSDVAVALALLALVLLWEVAECFWLRRRLATWFRTVDTAYDLWYGTVGILLGTVFGNGDTLQLVLGILITALGVVLSVVAPSD